MRRRLRDLIRVFTHRDHETARWEQEILEDEGLADDPRAQRAIQRVTHRGKSLMRWWLLAAVAGGLVALAVILLESI